MIAPPKKHPYPHVIPSDDEYISFEPYVPIITEAQPLPSSST